MTMADNRDAPPHPGPGTGPGQAPSPAERDSELLAASAALEDALRSGDAARLKELATADSIHIDTSGAVRPLADMGGQAGLPALPAEASRVVQNYGSLAMVTARSRTEGPAEIVALQVWIKSPDGGWRALIHHLNALADPDAPPPHPAPVPRPADAPAPRCSNPIEHVPYEPKSDEERDIIRSFQTLENAVVHNDADEWVKHMADEFVVYRTKQRPTTKAQRAGHLRQQREVNAETFVAAVEAMKLWTFGDTAVMRADHIMPENRRPPYRATRVWVKRDGRWQMAVSQQTTRAT